MVHHGDRERRWLQIWLVLGIILPCAVAMPAAGNEIGGNYAWSFRSDSSRSVAAQRLDLQLRYQNNYYGQWRNGNNISNSYTTNFAGDQVNCNLASNAAGNTDTSSAVGSASSPSVTNTPIVSSMSTGNSTAAQLGTSPAGAPLNSVQDNYGSPVTSGVQGTTSALTLGRLSSGGGQLTQQLTATQSNTNSPQTAVINDSSACAFGTSRAARSGR
jgi:hypothetical protein